VKLRVSLGGHAVPPEVVRRRFGRSLKNFVALYGPLASRWAVFNNSSPSKARLIAVRDDDKLNVKEAVPCLKLKKLAKKSL
jgi:predicted ABC-type ATPase